MKNQHLIMFKSDYKIENNPWTRFHFMYRKGQKEKIVILIVISITLVFFTEKCNNTCVFIGTI